MALCERVGTSFPFPVQPALGQSDFIPLQPPSAAPLPSWRSPFSPPHLRSWLLIFSIISFTGGGIQQGCLPVLSDRGFVRNEKTLGAFDSNIDDHLINSSTSLCYSRKPCQIPAWKSFPLKACFLVASLLFPTGDVADFKKRWWPPWRSCPAEMGTSHVGCARIALALSLLPGLYVRSAVPAAAPGSACSGVPGVGVMRWAALQPLAQPGLGSVMCPFPAPRRGALPCCTGEKEVVRHERNWTGQGAESICAPLPPALQVWLVHCRCQGVWGRTSWATRPQPAGGQPASRGLSLLRDQPCRLPQCIVIAWCICDTRRNCHHEELDKARKKGLRSVCERRGPTFVESGPTAFEGNRLALI